MSHSIPTDPDIVARLRSLRERNVPDSGIRRSMGARRLCLVEDKEAHLLAAGFTPAEASRLARPSGITFSSYP